MFVSYKILLYSLTSLISNSWNCTVNSYWKNFPYTGPVMFNYYSLIQNINRLECIATCLRLYNWDQIYFQGNDCYCLAPVYEKADKVSGTVTTKRAFVTAYYDAAFCSEKGYTLFLDQRYCLKYFATEETWYNAELTCQKDGGHLVSIYNQQDLANLISVGQNDDGSIIGAHRTPDGKELVWVTGGIVNNSFWRPGEPDFYQGIEKCVKLQNDLLFSDIPCHYTHELSFHCQILVEN